jgi:hypothetical protein
VTGCAEPSQRRTKYYRADDFIGSRAAIDVVRSTVRNLGLAGVSAVEQASLSSPRANTAVSCSRFKVYGTPCIIPGLRVDTKPV